MATHNKAEEGQPDDMDFICESDGALMCYVTDHPQLDEPSAGYTFTWDTTVAALVAWWKNNSFTHAALEGDKTYDRVKKSGY